jgi:hypothetical protein
MTKSTPVRDRPLVLIATLGVVFFCGFGALVYLLLSTPPRQPGPPLYPEPPVYSGATDVVITKADALERIPTLERERLIRFKTTDDIQKVLSFYEETMTKAGWSMFAKISPDQLNFYWTDGSIATGLYKTNVTTEHSEDGATVVTLETGVGTGVDNR